MFERQESLLERIAAVTKRFRAIRFWWSIAIITSVGSLAGYFLRTLVLDGVIDGKHAAMFLISTFAIAASASLIAVRFSYRNPRWIALKIEQKFPGLQQRLLTALSQPKPTVGAEPGFLQRRVMSDAVRHSITHRWTDAVPKPAAILSRLSGLLSLGVFAFVVALLMLGSPQQDAAARSQLFKAPKVVIEPGNTEVEKFSGLVISARFRSISLLPELLRLVTINDIGREQEVTMAQSLDDPVLSGYVPSIETPFRYRVIAPTWESDEYEVDVFEFPNVTRSDAVLAYPTYTAMGTKTIEDTVRVSAVEGTQVQWLLWLNKPVASLVIRDNQGSEISPVAVDETLNQWKFDATISATERWTIDLTDDKGRINKYPIALDARALPNRIPELKLVRAGDIIASPLEEVSLAATAEDDFGIVRAGISYQMADGEPQNIAIVESAPKGVKHSLEHLVELEGLKAQADQLMSYHFWAEDVSPDGEIRRTQSDLYFGEIRPFEEIFREGEAPPGGESPPKQGGSQQTEELAELQKQIISATWKIANAPKPVEQIKSYDADVKLIGESQEQAIVMAQELASSRQDRDPKVTELLGQLVEFMEQAVEQLTQAATSSSKLPLREALTSEQSAYQALLRLRAREIEVSRSRQQQSSKSSSASSQRRQQQLDALELENDENRYETQSQATDENTNDAERENRQVLNRLKELAQRQEDVNKQLAQLQSALEEAKDEKTKEEVLRQLKRLREQEQEMLREADELADRMQQPENNQSMSEQAEKLSEIRENLRRSSEALGENKASEALAAGTRAERELDEMSEEFRMRSAGQFDEAVREMRSEARELEKNQQQLGQQIEQTTNNREPGLRNGADRDAIQESLKEQQMALDELMEKIQKTVEDAEPAEPLLAKDLYETFRKAQESQLERRLSDTSELLRRGLDPQAEQIQRDAQMATSELARDLEKAANSVLGNEEKALERALGELERLEQALSTELQNANSESSGNERSTTQSQPERSDSESRSEGRQKAGQESSGDKQSDKQESKPQSGRESRGEGIASQLGESMAGPISGGGFREFSDALRDIEEMVGEPALRSEAAAIRDRTRQMRLELKRHSEQPKWSLVELTIAKPLRELKMKVSEELLRRTADRIDPVPIDRDPVPQEFSGAVRRYYESLGSGR